MFIAGQNCKRLEGRKQTFRYSSINTEGEKWWALRLAGMGLPVG